MNPTIERQQMVADLRLRGIRDHQVCKAMLTVPREKFLPDELQHAAYQDGPLPIGCQQTISQPFVVALMTTALQLTTDSRVLEIGTGSGYSAAVLGQLAKAVYSVERFAELAESAKLHLRALGYTNISVLRGDGTLGWPEHAPYDAVLVTAGGPHVPEALFEQLRIGGRLVIPVGNRPSEQQLMRYYKTGLDSYESEDLGGVRFVPLVGKAGWSDSVQ